MQVFKTYFDIIKKSSLIAIIINISVAILTLLLISTTVGSDKKDYKEEKTGITVFNNDNSEFSDNFYKFLKDNFVIVKTDNNKLAIKKALYYNYADSVITIPEGFGESFLNGEDVKLITECNPDLKASNYAEMKINKYLNLFKGYKNSTELTASEINKQVTKDLSKTSEVQLNNTRISSSRSSASLFYNAANYPITIMLILSIASVTIAFNKKDVFRRNNCSAIKMSKFNLQIISGHLCITLLTFIIVSIIGISLFKINLSTTDGILHILNLFIFSIVALSIAYILSTFMTERAIPPVSVVVTLGTCFLGGSFVPQEFLPDGVKYTSIVNPVWWFVKANNTITSVSDYSFSNLKPAITAMGIEILFAIVFFLGALMIIKYKRTKD